MYSTAHKLVIALVLSVLITTAPICEGKRSLSSGNRKTSSGGGYSTRRQPSTSVTKPAYNTNSGSSSNSHVDPAKLSYSNYNAQPNNPGGVPNANNKPIGWNVPSQNNAGPPPAYSAQNVPGGAKTNMQEPPPLYQKPSYGAAPPSYNQAVGTNYGAAPQHYSPGAIPAGATYHSPNNLPAGASYYNPSQLPGGYAAGGTYPNNFGSHHTSGGIPAGGAYYPSSQSLPQGATYLPAGNALPPGAVFYSSPPQQSSSGLGFGSGLAAGALGGAILGHVLTPTQTRVVEQSHAASAGSSDNGHDRIIIINNGQPVNATDANGVTVINNGVTPAPSAAVETPVPLAPLAPVPANTADINQNATNPVETPVTPVPAFPVTNSAANPEQPPTGGIICVPVRINETDPNDVAKMIEVEKIACYPAPPPQPQVGGEAMDPNKPTETKATTPAEMSAPITAGASSQQLQQESTKIGDQTIKSAIAAAKSEENSFMAILMCIVLSYLIAYN